MAEPLCGDAGAGGCDWGLVAGHRAAQGKRAIEVYKSIRHLLKGDFYSLFAAQLQSLDTWDGGSFTIREAGKDLRLCFGSDIASSQRQRSTYVDCAKASLTNLKIRSAASSSRSRARN